MDLGALELFAVEARQELIRGVSDKIAYALTENSAIRRSSPKAVETLAQEVKAIGKDAVVEKTTYTWFNRFCALRFMDVNGYTDSGVVTPLPGGTLPGILAEARDGNFDDSIFASSVKDRVRNILAGKTREDDPNAAAYRALFIATCNAWNARMPFLFEKIGDWTEILLPDDLLSANSILAKVRDTLTPEVCADVEVIGWLYQFYISEKKARVLDRLNRKVKVADADISTATALFTPEWIVRYMTDNSLGRWWMRKHPDSPLLEKLEYYVPDDPQAATIDDLPDTDDITQLRVCDTSCGSGHILVYAFELLYLMYEELGYAPAEIPRHILQYNLRGYEIDERAASLASFALFMKACRKYPRFLRNPVTPGILCFRNIEFAPEEKSSPAYRRFVDFSKESALDIESDIARLATAGAYGSLLRIQAPEGACLALKHLVDEMCRSMPDSLFGQSALSKLAMATDQLVALSSKNHVTISNPPYLGSGGMNTKMAAWFKENYADVKSDLFAAFIVRNCELTVPGGFLGFMSPFVWMFISSYEKLREMLINNMTITTLDQLEYSGFAGATVPICTFALENIRRENYRGGYIRLSNYRGSSIQGPKTVEITAAARSDETASKDFFRASAEDFKNIPGSPIAYWLSEKFVRAFAECHSVGREMTTREGMATSNNDLFMRFWAEVSLSRIAFSTKPAEKPAHKWVPYNKGGEFRRWFGNNYHIVNWENDGYEIKHSIDAVTGRIRSHNYNGIYGFRPGLTWSAISSGMFSVRKTDHGYLFDSKGPKGFAEDLEYYAALLNSKTSLKFLEVLAPTIDFKVGDIIEIPVPLAIDKGIVRRLAITCIDTSKDIWNSYETSWDFTWNPLVSCGLPELASCYSQVRLGWKRATEEMRRLETENNRIFIEAYGLQDELTPEVPWNEITLTCNPWYRYGKTTDSASEEMPEDVDLEARLQADTVKELLSYAVGCMMGRYSLKKPGLILADQGATLEDFKRQVPDQDFEVDDDGIIPVLDNDLFADDIVTRFKDFIKKAFGEAHYFQNIEWIESSLGKSIRDYFTKDFYKDHLQRYQNRPIYWMFQSPKGAFRALVYMHRYTPDMVGRVLGYLRSMQTKVENLSDVAFQVFTDESRSSRERALANRETEKLAKIRRELNAYEKNVLYPLSTERIEIDLDDGVKVNYKKFGEALAKVKALEGRGE